MLVGQFSFPLSRKFAVPSLPVVPLRRVVATTHGRMVAGLIILFLIAYLGLAQRIIATGYEATELSREVVTLRQRNADLRLKAAQLRSLVSVTKNAESLQMATPLGVRYLAPEGLVALEASTAVHP